MDALTWTLWLVLWLVVTTLGGLGNTVGYHRLLTHRSFVAAPAVRAGLTLLGATTSGSPVFWVALHRLHHLRSDDPEEDPHSPRRGFWWAHCGWLIGVENPLLCAIYALSGFGQQATILWHDLKRLAGRNPPTWHSMAKDLMKEPLLALLDAPLVMPALFALQLFVAWQLGGWWGIAWLWAMHAWLTNTSWAVNSICHLPSQGRAPHDTGDDSRDVPWMALLTHGEGYHNGHHRFPRSARHALDGGADLSWAVIRWLEGRGLAEKVWLPRKYRTAPVDGKPEDGAAAR